VHLAGGVTSGILTGMKHSSPAERVQWAQRFYQSGLSQREFAAQHRLRLSTLQRWLRLRQNPLPSPAPSFAEIKLPRVTSRWALEVICCGLFSDHIFDRTGVIGFWDSDRSAIHFCDQIAALWS